MTASYHHQFGLHVTFFNSTSGFSLRLPDDWTIAQLGHYLAELAEFAA